MEWVIYFFTSRPKCKARKQVLKIISIKWLFVMLCLEIFRKIDFVFLLAFLWLQFNGICQLLKLEHFQKNEVYLVLYYLLQSICDFNRRLENQVVKYSRHFIRLSFRKRGQFNRVSANNRDWDWFNGIVGKRNFTNRRLQWARCKVGLQISGKGFSLNDVIYMFRLYLSI